MKYSAETPSSLNDAMRKLELADDEIERLRTALQEISKGKGRFSRDSFQHAKNTIEDMKALAVDALSRHKDGGATG